MQFYRKIVSKIEKFIANMSKNWSWVFVKKNRIDKEKREKNIIRIRNERGIIIMIILE